MSLHQKDAIMKAHISQWKTSGLTQVAYCNEHGIKPHIFSYYKGWGQKDGVRSLIYEEGKVKRNRGLFWFALFHSEWDYKES